jgi:hypothetical protein
VSIVGNRMRFNKREKELLASGVLNIEVSYGSGQWIAFNIASGEIEKDYSGYQRTKVGRVASDYNTKGQKSKVISKGWAMRGTPGHIRPVGSDWKVT